MKELIRDILQRFGYDIIKTGLPYIPKSKNTGVVTVGKYPVQMPGNSLQLVNYQLYPDLNIQLGRLALVISQKYPGMTLIDVGANVGDTIAVVKSLIDLPIIAVEGDEICCSYLEKNIQQFKQVDLIKTYLGEKAEEIHVDLEHSGWNTTIIPDDKGGQQISFKTLDEVINGNGFGDRDLKLLKVDVEGFDTIVLRGAYGIIEKHHPVLFFEYNRKSMKVIQEEGLSTILNFAKYGYQKIGFFDHKGNLVLATDLQNTEVVTYMHDYVSSDKNLLAYYDICIFHQTDADLANNFLQAEKAYL